MKAKPHFSLLLATITLVSSSLPFARAYAQWQTQTFNLDSGWNPIYLHLDASHVGISELVGDAPIDEIWLWSPSVNEAQFVLAPDAPAGSKSRWIEWKNSLGDNTSKLKRLVGNSAYLVKLADGVSSLDWNLKGKPLPPLYNWTTSGLNFVGFPANPASTLNLESYFLKAGSFLSQSKFYNYTSGELGRNNPAEVFGLRTTPLTRGRAYWVDTGSEFNRYYAPFQIRLQDYRGLAFGAKAQSARVRLRNMTTEELTIRVSSVASESAPDGEAAEADLQAALLIRGNINADTQLYDFQACPCQDLEITLGAAGTSSQEVEIVLGLDRSKIVGVPGQKVSALLRLQDSLNYAQIDLPISAEIQSFEGLWVGEAVVDGVSRTGQATPQGVATTFPLRYIIHQQDVSVVAGQAQVAGSGVSISILPTAIPLYSGEVISFSNGSQLTLTEATAVNGNQVTGNLVGDNGISDGLQGYLRRLNLLQRTYIGLLPGEVSGLATQETLLDPAEIASATRISSSHLPYSELNNPWPLQGSITPGGIISGVVTVGFDDQISSPFLHTYHPDHDNLNADFDTQLARGMESYDIKRELQFDIQSEANGFNAIVGMGGRIAGVYTETISLSGLATEGAANENTYQVSGKFELIRISHLSQLHQP
ncbi:MAG: hypothetical protein VXW84_04480 [Verrucomicrobiota bacterium]|nr:hypothetical protein [Verrucomicrobiota bacterium]